VRLDKADTEPFSNAESQRIEPSSREIRRRQRP